MLTFIVLMDYAKGNLSEEYQIEAWKVIVGAISCDIITASLGILIASEFYHG